MVRRRELGTQDALWLVMDRPNNLMVVDCVMWTAEPLDLERTKAVMAERLWDRYPVFRSRAERDGDGSWWWVEDPGASFESLVDHVVLDDPDDPRCLQELVASLRSEPLGLDGPLWRVILVEEYLGGSALVTRSHHAVADGMRMMQLAASLFDATPQGGPILTPAPEQYAARSEHEEPGALERLRSSADALRRQAAGTAEAVVATTNATSDLARRAPGVVGAGLGAARVALTNPLGAAHGWITGTWAGATDAVASAGHRVGDAVAGSGPLVDVFSAAVGDVDTVRKLILGTRNDATVWSGPAGADKAVGWSEPLPLERVKSVAHAQGATVNDVLVACVAGTLRAYLASRGEHCASVAVMVPVNLTPMDLTLPEDLGNSFALVQLELPTDEEDPLVVLRTVHHRMERIKHGHEAAVAFRIQETLAGLGRSVYEASVDLLANRTIGVLTNVPGPPMPVYLAGAEVQGMTGWAPLSGDQPLSFTIYSYNGSVTVGIACDRTLVPDHELIVDGFAAAFEELTSTAGVP